MGDDLGVVGGWLASVRCSGAGPGWGRFDAHVAKGHDSSRRPIKMIPNRSGAACDGPLQTVSAKQRGRIWDLGQDPFAKCPHDVLVHRKTAGAIDEPENFV